MNVGHGDYWYENVVGWGKGPQGYTFGIASGVAVDSQDRVYVVDREPHPAIVVFDREGRFLTAWGQQLLVLPHDIWIGPDDRLYIADCGNHTVRICTTEGKLLQTIGTPRPLDTPGEPFNMPTRAVCSPSGDIYVSDGYRHYQIHRYTADGTLLQSWGSQGSQPGQFSLPHNVFIAPDGRVLVCDREPNQRVQIFDANGAFLSEWPGRLFPCSTFVDKDGIVYLAESGGISIFNLEGKLLSRFTVPGGPTDVNHGVHDVWVDRHGDLYVGEVGAPNLLYKYTRV